MLLIAFCFNASAQKKINGKKIKQMKEYTTEDSKKYLSELTKYNAEGKKSEVIKYNEDGTQKERTVYQYNNEGKCITELEYDESNALDEKTVIEYSGGKKLKETVSKASGKIKKVRNFEYVTE